MNLYEHEIRTFREELLKINHPIVNIESFDRYIETNSDNIPKVLINSIKILYQDKLDTETMRNVMVSVGFGKFWDNITPIELYKNEIEFLVSQRMSRLTNNTCSITLDNPNFRKIMEVLRINELEIAGAFMLDSIDGKTINASKETVCKLYTIIDSGNICCVNGDCKHEQH